MGHILAGLEPERVFHYFEEICAIPHSSGHTKQLSDYCKALAQQKGYSFVQDQWNNLIIKKPASVGYEQVPAVILQGHLDMVPEKESYSAHDFTKDPLELFVEDGWIGAKDTTLGGDDGVAVAMMLAILEDDSLEHPALECMFTTDEETGLDGAIYIDMSQCEGKYMINLDSEEEGYLLTGCAGGTGSEILLPVKREKVFGRFCKVTVCGLNGGHSGADIHKEMANANILMGRLLYQLDKEMSFSLCTMVGGNKGNAITRECTATVVVSEADLPKLQLVVDGEVAQWKNEYQTQDPNVKVTVSVEDTQTVMAVEPEQKAKIISLMMTMPYGVQHMSVDVEGFVETSVNPGILELNEESFAVRFSIRSSLVSRRELMVDKLANLARLAGAKYSRIGSYPGWQFRKDSKLRELVCDVYQQLTGKSMVVCAIHAGLECGILLEKKPELDIVSLGPDMKQVHTPSERLNIASTARTYALLKAVLAAMKNGF